MIAAILAPVASWITAFVCRMAEAGSGTISRPVPAEARFTFKQFFHPGAGARLGNSGGPFSRVLRCDAAGAAAG
jgi:hypothetical protein